MQEVAAIKLGVRLLYLHSNPLTLFLQEGPLNIWAAQSAMLCSEHMAMMRGVSKLLGRELALVGIIL